MGKGSRKKAWRKVKTDDLEAAVQKANEDARNGGPVEELPDDSLFFVDAEPEEALRPSKKERRQALKNKVLHTDRALQTKALAVYPTSTPAYRKADTFSKHPALKTKHAGIVKASKSKFKTPKPYDLWDQGNVEQATEDIPRIAPYFYSDDTTKKPRRKAPIKRSALPAVEVDADGCSYNPDFEAHQETLAVAVATEVQKELKSELNPAKIATATGSLVEAYLEDELFRARSDDEEEEEGEEAAGRAEEGEEEATAPRKGKAKEKEKLTKAERNRQVRKRERQKEEQERRDLKKQRRDLQALPELQAQLEDQRLLQAARKERRDKHREEKAAMGPGRLGKVLFEEAPVQVQLSEDVNGSIRTLKACSTLAKDRFKSLQKRAIIEPRNRANPKKAKNKLEYEPGTRGQTARDMHEARMAERAMGKSMV